MQKKTFEKFLATYSAKMGQVCEISKKTPTK